MKRGGLGTAGRDLRTLLEGGSVASLSDGELLARFVNGRGNPLAESAFDTLVSRYGPMVWGTSRRILRDPHAAEDAFQATFLVLVKKAGSIRVDDSLGRWLHGVAVRVALRARLDRARRGDRDLTEVEASVSNPEILEIREVIDEEVQRLPSNYRSVVVLCHLEGLTREHAASRLRCPVGTVNSRLSRASEILRARLTRRGLAPATGGLAVWLVGAEASAAVPTRLVGLTVSASLKFALSGTLAGLVPVGVGLMMNGYLRGKLMTKIVYSMALLAGLATVGTIGLAQQGVGSKQSAPDPIKLQAPVVPSVPPTLEEQVKAIKAEWVAARQAYFRARETVKGEADRALLAEAGPDVTAFSKRFLTLAQTKIDDPAARDALLWVLEQFWISDAITGEWAMLRAQVMDLLVEHHGDDIKVAWTALSMDKYTSPNRDRFLPALYEKARNPRTRGTAALALAQYRWKQAQGSFGKKLEKPLVYRDDHGKTLAMPNDMVAYESANFERDPAPFRAEAFRLLEEIIHDHSDEPYDTRRGTTFGQKALELFDEWAKLDVGQPAPSFEGKDLAEKPVKLADYRGRVVVLVFWASWCEPCVKQIPIEKELARRFQDRPFALLGVNCDESSEQARKVALDKELTWVSLFDGSKRLGPCEIDMGPVSRLYHVNRLPSVYLIDAQGIIRQKRTSVVDLEESVENLLKEIEPQSGESR